MSYMIVNKETGFAVLELFNKPNEAKLNTDKYMVMTALDYLVSLNKKIGGQND